MTSSEANFHSDVRKLWRHAHLKVSTVHSQRSSFVETSTADWGCQSRLLFSRKEQVNLCDGFATGAVLCFDFEPCAHAVGGAVSPAHAMDSSKQHEVQQHRTHKAAFLGLLLGILSQIWILVRWGWVGLIEEDVKCESGRSSEAFDWKVSVQRFLFCRQNSCWWKLCGSFAAVQTFLSLC